MPQSTRHNAEDANVDRRRFTPATVLRTSVLSPAVRSLVLQLHEGTGPAFQYEAGQWVDFASDDIPEVGGFSMCAPPSGAAFARRRELELAVKQSRHPVSQWVHDPERCKPGARVRVRAGGRFTLSLADGGGGGSKSDEEAGAAPSCDAGVVFLAGGIGVTALGAMAGELCERWRRAVPNTSLTGPRRATVLYSARTPEDLALLPRLRAWAAEAAEAKAAAAARGSGDDGRPPLLTVQVHVTGGEDQQLPGEEEEGHKGVVRWRRGRITAEEARHAVDALCLLDDASSSPSPGSSGVGVFVCGPPRMTDELAAAIAEHPRVGKARVFTERWW